MLSLNDPDPTPRTQDCSSIMADADNAGVSAPSGVYEVGVRSGFANVTLRVWCDMDTRDGITYIQGLTDV